MGGNPDKHYVTFIMHAEVLPSSAPLDNCEPHKCAGWEWVSWDELKEKAMSDSSADFFEPAAKAIAELAYPFSDALMPCL